jgi:hypothetical protein
MRSRGAEGNCMLGLLFTAIAVFKHGLSRVVAAVAADFARKCLRVMGAKTAPV